MPHHLVLLEYSFRLGEFNESVSSFLYFLEKEDKVESSSHLRTLFCLPLSFHILEWLCPGGLDTLMVLINGHSDIPALFPVIRMFSAKHQHLGLNHFPLTVPVLQPSARHAKSVIYKEPLPSPSLHASKGERSFIIHCDASSLPRYILLLQTRNSSLACGDRSFRDISE